MSNYTLGGRPITAHALNAGYRWQDIEGPFRILSQEQASDWNEGGCFVLEDALDPLTVSMLEEEIDPQEEKTERFLRKQKDGTFGIARASEISFTTHMVLRSEKLKAFCRGRLFQDLCFDLLGPDVRLYWDQAVYKKPGTESPFPWHQDNGYTFVEPQSYVTCWIAVSDATEDNGCPWVVRGLHQRGTLHHERTRLGFQCVEDPEDAVCVPVKTGSLVVFSSLTPHATGPNRTPSVRKAYIVQFAVSDTRRVERDPESGALVIEPQEDESRQFEILRGGKAIAD